MLALLDCCCGLDVHKDIIQACILKGSPDEEPISIRAEFKAIQSDLQAMCSWLFENECLNVAMESTGVYWRPVYEACEEFLHGCRCLMVVNAHHMRNLPGRKSDVKDSEWIATLFRHGLLEPSFIPNKLIRNLREYSRLHRSFVEERARYSNRLEKFLQTHGFKLSSVLSSILGVSGRRLLAVLSQKGVLSPIDVNDAIDKRVKKSMAEISATVSGKLDYAERSYLNILLCKVDALDKEITDIFALMSRLAEPYKIQLDQLDSIPGIDVSAALAIIAETSATPQESFENSKKLISWAGLSPRNDESAGKIKSRKITKGNPYIKAILCQVAWAAVRSRRSCFHDWFWTHQGKLGRKKAIIAVARKILALIYKLLKSGEFYDPMQAIKPIQSLS
jgi:transposase